ncbi:MAG: phosphohydrolase [Candidatus Omnitrophica bacterium]|nr:phosphohydrolase [Candidatus Omnitrophota bacterium]
MKCPGTDSRFLKVEIKKCCKCGYEVEIFSDESKVKCPVCKNYVRKEMASCIDWCRYAKLCTDGKNDVQEF